MSHLQPKTPILHFLSLALVFLFLSLCALLGTGPQAVAYGASAGAPPLADSPTGFGTVPPLTLTKQASQSYVKPGERITYTLRVSSQFTLPVSVRLTDTLPSALHAVSAPTATQGMPFMAGAMITWTATISPAQVILLHYSGVITGVVENQMITNQVILQVADYATVTKTASVQVKTHWQVWLPLIQTPFPFPTVANSNFEAGPHQAWEETSANFGSLIVAAEDLPAPITPHSPRYVAWLGGKDKETADLAQTIFIPPGYPTLKLHYFYWIASLDNQCGGNSDLFELHVNALLRQAFDLCKAHNTNGWQEGFISVAEYAGQSVKFHFKVTLDNAQNSNFFIDDVAFCTNCGQ